MGLILFSAISPLLDIYATHKYYNLNPQTSALVGNVSSNLAKQIPYDAISDAYIFNKDGMEAMTTTVGSDKVLLVLIQPKVDGGYSIELCLRGSLSIANTGGVSPERLVFSGR